MTGTERPGADVVQVLLSPRIGGAESLAATLEHQWRAQGFDPRTVYLDPATGPRTPLGRVQHLEAVLRRLRPRAVLAHSALPNVYARLSAPPGIAVCVVMHGGDDFADPKLRRAERILRMRTTAVVTVNEEQQRRYRQRFGNRIPVVRIPNAISPTMIPRPASVDEQPLTAVTVARVVAQKQPAFWVTVAAAAATVIPELRFDWWGPMVESEETARAVALIDGVRTARFRGSTDRPDEAYAQAGLLFHPAAAEAQSIGLLEAAACGVPIVCSDTVGATLDARVPRVEFASGEVDDAVRALAETVADLPAARRRAEGVAAQIRSDYSAEACAARYAELLGISAPPGSR